MNPAEGVQLSAESSSVGGTFARQRLGRLLDVALTETAAWFGRDVGYDPFAGLHLDADAAARALSTVTTGATPHVNPEVLAPRWSDVLDHDPRWAWLRTAYGLSDFELDVVLLALAPELDLRYTRVFGFLHDDLGQKLPTVDLALNLLTADSNEKLCRRVTFATDAPLLRHRILVPVPGRPAPPQQAAALQLDQQIVDVLLGIGGLDRRLHTSCRLSAAHTSATANPRSSDLPDTVRSAIDAAWGRRPLILYLHGPPDVGKRDAGQAAAAHLRVPLLSVRSRRLSRDAALDDELAIVFREAELQGALVFFEDLDSFDGNPACRAALDEHLADYGGVVILSGTSAWTPLGRHALGVMAVPFGVPDLARRRSAWSDALRAQGASPPLADIDGLASRFKVSVRQIDDAVQTAVLHAHTRGSAADGAISPTTDDLFAAARAQSGSELAAHAQKIEPAFGWEDIVLSDEVGAQLRELGRQVAHRDRVMNDWGFGRTFPHGKGISALFAGPPGTGKTMAAEVIAGELGVDLYRIDLSAVISKYIGETEKNLEKIFAAAPQANACLLFDEADALFGKRSAVHDAHDRYANQEVSYLLQRMEHYDGLAILTTNRRDHLDEAFTRRLQFIVEFPVPSERDRQRIWRRCIPRQAPCDPAVDLEWLARMYPLPGGNISNIALRAAHLAAADDSTITVTHFMSAVASEYQKMSRVAPAVALDRDEPIEVLP